MSNILVAIGTLLLGFILGKTTASEPNWAWLILPAAMLLIGAAIMWVVENDKS